MNNKIGQSCRENNKAADYLADLVRKENQSFNFSCFSDMPSLLKGNV